MTAKCYLQQLQKINIIIEQKLSEINDLRLKATNSGGIDYSKENVKTSPSGNASFENIIENIILLENEINSEIDKFVNKKHFIINQIQALPSGKYIAVLYKRYVEFKSIEIIAAEMNYTYQYIVELHGDALEAFQKTYKNLLKTYD